MRRTERGFTLVEVVLAVTIAVLVSISAASVILATRTTSRDSTYALNASSHANTVLECFKASDNMTEFGTALEFAYGVTGGTKLNINKENCNTSAGCTLYLYFAKDGTLCAAGSVANKISAQWEHSVVVSGNCDYFAAVNVAKCKDVSGAFKPATTLNVVIYRATDTYGGAEPVLANAADDAKAVYYFASAYKKGAVTD